MLNKIVVNLTRPRVFCKRGLKSSGISNSTMVPSNADSDKKPSILNEFGKKQMKKTQY